MDNIKLSSEQVWEVYVVTAEQASSVWFKLRFGGTSPSVIHVYCVWTGGSKSKPKISL